MLGDDLEYQEDRVEHKQPSVLKKNITLKLKSASISSSSPSTQSNIVQPVDEPAKPNPAPSNGKLILDEPASNIAHFESSLNWNLNVNLIGEKILDQKMDYCMLCGLPILIYGRLTPCQHFMCMGCANNNGLKLCLKETCHEKIQGIERVSREQIFVCGHDGNNDFDLRTEHASFRLQPEISQKNQCGRSFLTQTDLDTHIRDKHDRNAI